MDLNWGLNICYEYICYLISCLWFAISIVLAPRAAFQFLMSKLYNDRDVTDAHAMRRAFQTIETCFQKAKVGALQKIETCLQKAKVDKDYVGLWNQGSIFYLNALLQCLYHTPKFREKLSTNTNKLNETYLAVDNIFHKLDEKVHPATTNKLTKSLGLDPFKQQDVPEIFQLLLNALDVDTAEGPCFKEVFLSTMVNLMQCLECREKDGYQTAMNITVLPLAVIPTPDKMPLWSVAEALKQFQTTKNMTEENQIYCSKCKKKTDTTLTQTFTRLPPVLVVQLKRFEYIFRYNSFAKIHDEVLINRTIDVEYEVETQLKNKSYELFAICDHRGEFWGGHYTAIINPEDKHQWYSFNDSSVDIVNETSFPKHDCSRWTQYKIRNGRKHGQKPSHPPATCLSSCHPPSNCLSTCHPASAPAILPPPGSAPAVLPPPASAPAVLPPPGSAPLRPAIPYTLRRNILLVDSEDS